MTKIVSKLRLRLVTTDTTSLSGKKFVRDKGGKTEKQCCWQQLLHHLVKFTNPTFCPKGV